MAVVGPSRHSRVSMSVSMSLMQGGGAGTTGGGGTTGPGAHPGQAVLAAAAAAAAAAATQPTPTYYHPAAPAPPPPPPPAQDPVQPDRPIGYGAFGVVWYISKSEFEEPSRIRSDWYQCGGQTSCLAGDAAAAFEHVVEYHLVVSPIPLSPFSSNHIHICRVKPPTRQEVGEACVAGKLTAAAASRKISQHP
ncbi:serine/threonine-protein kinase NLK isoform X1, partial [Vespula squamosa]